jgi:hypothetical protein
LPPPPPLRSFQHPRRRHHHHPRHHHTPSNTLAAAATTTTIATTTTTTAGTPAAFKRADSKAMFEVKRQCDVRGKSSLSQSLSSALQPRVPEYFRRRVAIPQQQQLVKTTT